MRPPTARAATASGSARSSEASSPLTSMRSAWKVRLAGWPPVRRVAAGIEERTSSASRAVPVNGSVARSRTMASAMRRAKRSSPYLRSTRARSPAP